MKLPEGQEAFRWFVEKIVRVVVGGKNFDKKVVHEDISKFVTGSDEAFAFLILEKVRDNKDWTETHAAKRGGGWKNEGLARFRELHKAVKEWREEDERKKEEGEIRKEESNRRNAVGGVKRKRIEDEAPDIGLPDDFDD